MCLYITSVTKEERPICSIHRVEEKECTCNDGSIIKEDIYSGNDKHL